MRLLSYVSRFVSVACVLRLTMFNSVCVSVLLVATVYVIYFYGPILRKLSPFARQLMGMRVEMQTQIRSRRNSDD